MDLLEEIEGSKYLFKQMYESRYAKIFSQHDTKSLYIQVTNNFIPIDEFKVIFSKSTEIISSDGLAKIIFDKRKMTVFHQPSMEWYFINWKDEIYNKYQVKAHRKILPDDNLFVQSVKIARKKLDETYPEATYKLLDIQYMDSVDSALEN